MTNIKLKNVVIVDDQQQDLIRSNQNPDKRNKIIEWICCQPHMTKFKICGLENTFQIYQREDFCYLDYLVRGSEIKIVATLSIALNKFGFEIYDEVMFKLVIDQIEIEE